MSFLNHNQIEDYNNKGYVSPINIFSKQEAKEIREEIEKIEKKWPEALTGLNRNYVHLISPVFDKICHNSKILDAVESLIGKNILICGTTLFIKDPDKKGFVSWHQDAKYIGFEPYNWVTAWLAITDANEENGCMRMWSGSHKENIKDHKDTYDKNNGDLLSFCNISNLNKFISKCKKFDIKIGLAGSLKETHIPLMMKLKPNILGFRSAICKFNKRMSEVDTRKLKKISRHFNLCNNKAIETAGA